MTTALEELRKRMEPALELEHLRRLIAELTGVAAHYYDCERRASASSHEPCTCGVDDLVARAREAVRPQ